MRSQWRLPIYRSSHEGPPLSQRQDRRGRNNAPLPRSRQPAVMSVQSPEIANPPGAYLSVGKRTLQPLQVQGILLSPRDTRTRGVRRGTKTWL